MENQRRNEVKKSRRTYCAEIGKTMNLQEKRETEDRERMRNARWEKMREKQKNTIRSEKGKGGERNKKIRLFYSRYQTETETYIQEAESSNGDYFFYYYGVLLLLMY